MRAPLDLMIVVPGGDFRVVAQPGTGLSDSQGIKRHIGVDLRAGVGTPVYAPGTGVVTQSYTSGTTGNQTIEIRIGDYLWRFLHLSQRRVTVGQIVPEGQVIGLTGNSGGVAAHLHVDTRRNGTLWNASLENYVNPLDLIKKESAMSNPSAGTVDNAYKTFNGRFATPEEKRIYTSKDWEVGDGLYYGKVEKEVASLFQRIESLTQQVELQRTQLAERDAELVELKKQTNELIRLNGVKDDEIAQLKAELANSGSDTVNLNALGQALQWLIKRLGLK